jgi:hypothetical protein
VEHLISLDTHNRPKKESHINYLAEELKAGRGVTTNKGIGICTEGWITDGGHWLRALRRAGYPPVYMWIIRNLQPEAQKVIDIGTKRTMSDILNLLLDVSISAKIVAVLNVRLKSRFDWMRGKWSPDALVAEFEACEDGLKKTANVKGWSDVPAPIRAAVLDIYDETKDDAVWAWLDKIIRGEHIGKGDPAYAFRKWHLDQKNSTGGTDMQIKRWYYSLLSLRAYVEKRNLSKFLLPVPEKELANHIKSLQGKKIARAPALEKKAA